jgi:hypothetical protein
MLELLRHPTPELSYTLKDVIAVFIWEYGSYCGVPYRSSRACLMVELLFTLNADNGQIFLMDRPGNRPGIQGKLSVKHMAGG